MDAFQSTTWKAIAWFQDCRAYELCMMIRAISFQLWWQRANGIMQKKNKTNTIPSFSKISIKNEKCIVGLSSL